MTNNHNDLSKTEREELMGLYDRFCGDFELDFLGIDEVIAQALLIGSLIKVVNSLTQSVDEETLRQVLGALASGYLWD